MPYYIRIFLLITQIISVTKTGMKVDGSVKSVSCHSFSLGTDDGSTGSTHILPIKHGLRIGDVLSVREAQWLTDSFIDFGKVISAL